MKRTPIREVKRLTGIWRLEQRSRVVEGAGVGIVIYSFSWVKDKNADLYGLFRFDE